MADRGKKPTLLYFEEAGESIDLGKTFSQLGIEAKAYSDPREFLTQVHSTKPNLCCLNIGKDKEQVPFIILKTIRKVLGAEPPVIVVVKKEDKPLITKMLEAGANDFLEKPIDLPLLTEKISKYITLPKQVTKSNATEPPALPEVPIPEVVGWFFEKFSPVMGALNSSLEDFDEVETQLQFYSERILPFREQFVTMVNNLSKRDYKADLTQSMRLYGLNNVRYLVVAARLSEATGGVFQWNQKTGFPIEDPKKLIQYAVKASEKFGEAGRYRQVAFNSGLVMDLLSILAEVATNRKGTIRKQIDNSFQECLKKAEVGFQKAKALKDLSLEKHIITTMMMREAGKIAMSIQYADYGDLRSKMEKKGIKPALQHIAETKKYSISHNLMGSLICQVSPGLSEAYKSVLFVDVPFLLKGPKEDFHSYTLANFCGSLL